MELCSFAHTIAGNRFFLVFISSSMKYILANCFLNASDLRESIPASGSSDVRDDELPVGMDDCGSVVDASVRKADATENWPSRKKCMPIARLIKTDCEESTSELVVGSGLSLNFYPRSGQSRRNDVTPTNLLQGL